MGLGYWVSHRREACASEQIIKIFISSIQAVVSNKGRTRLTGQSGVFFAGLIIIEVKKYFVIRQHEIHLLIKEAHAIENKVIRFDGNGT